ncbi:MAG: D-alanyl-D-alanine carboxypeptidase/D-alanyl-D-alanine-endopeptidase [Planctomycetota bacterium]|nr:MAG: D-alanyl-D-alanine carboxypeptidase/D-alanyl-D-alanine-endopeptidase [Planctomycetota bacterium]
MRTVGAHQRWTWIAAVFAAVLAAVLAAPVAVGQSLDTQIEVLLAHTPLGEARVGVSVIDVQTGDTLAAIRDGEAFIPASNMKLLTTGAALLVLGESFEFRTTLERAGGTLALRGSGDPALADPALLEEMGLGVEDLLGRWVDAVRRSGGPVDEVVVDASVFDDRFVHPSWPADQLNRWYAAEVAGLNFYTNVVSFYLARDQPGQPPRVTLEPSAPWLRVRNRARTVDRGQNTVWVARPATSNEMTVFGALRHTLAEPIPVAVHDPPMVAGRLLADRLARAGLGEPAVRVVRAGDAPPAPGETIAVVRSPISTVLRRCNVDSQNLYAEALLKRLGREVTGRAGAFETGAAVVRMTIEETLGPADAAATVIADGSGLSRDNRVTPGAMARWLARLAQDERAGDAFIESLPIAGDEGTLASRFRGMDLAGVVRAKSGYISRVSCLSGYVLDADTGRAVVFSVLVNDIPQHRVPISRVKALQESIVQVIDGWLAEQGAAVADADALGG